METAEVRNARVSAYKRQTMERRVAWSALAERLQNVTLEIQRAQLLSEDEQIATAKSVATRLRAIADKLESLEAS